MSTFKWFLPLLLLCACGQGAQVLSSDGSKLITFCGPTGWTKCASEACPRGYDVVVSCGGDADGCVLKCKP
jgi:hypothetical protein